MKKALSLLFFVGYSILVFGDNRKNPESLPLYSVEKTEKNPSLKNDEAEFIFTCNNLQLLPYKNGKAQQHFIDYSANGEKNRTQLNRHQKFTVKLKPGVYLFQFFILDHFEIYTDSIKILPSNTVHVTLNFEHSKYPVVAEKPVIYVYSPEKKEINIDLQPSGEFIFTYPLFNNGWFFTTDSTGKIETEGKNYKYLFYDANIAIDYKDVHSQDGFLVSKEELLPFLESSLSEMNFSSSEQQDFITYWYPKMIKNESNFIRFIFNEEYNNYASMTVNPKPDNMLRVFMIWTNAASLDYTLIKPQVLPSLERSGYFILEWGGSEILFPEN